MAEKQEMWTIEELVAMTETVQNAEIEYAGKVLPIQWCELTESEEPKLSVPEDGASSEEVTEHYKTLAQHRVVRMIAKANDMNPDGAIINTEDDYNKLPTTIRWQVSGKVLGGDTADFISG